MPTCTPSNTRPTRSLRKGAAAASRSSRTSLLAARGDEQHLLDPGQEADLLRRVAAGQAAATLDVGPLTRRQRQLAGRIQADGRRAMDVLVRRNMGLVVQMASRMRKPENSLDDLIQDGVAGLVKGIRRFDPATGYRLTTYVVWWIRQSISRSRDRQTGPMWLPEEANALLARAAELTEQHTGERMAAATSAQVAARLDVSERRLVALQAAQRSARSLDFIAPDGTAMHEQLPTPDTQSVGHDPAAVAERTHIHAWAHRLLAGLPDDQRQIIAMRFGLDEDPQTLRTVAAKTDLTVDQVRYLEYKALTSLREAVR